MIRQPAVAGQFYPASAQALAREIARWVDRDAEPASAIAVVAPHAGYTYSGSVAGAVYSRVRIPESVVIVGVNHRGLGPDAALSAEGAWSMPTGEVPIDEPLALSILERSSTLREDVRAHQHEHSLEVQVPFLQHFQPDLKIVPIAIYGSDIDTCRDVGEACAEAIGEAGRPVLLVASTDLSHEQQDYERVKANDPAVIDRMLALDPEGLLREVAERRVTMCGSVPTAAVLLAANLLGAGEAELVKYSDSYAVNLSEDYVVGYVGILIR